jgi:hypothetical protein
VGVEQAPLQTPLLTGLLAMPNGDMMLPTMAKLGIVAIVFGAMLFALGIIPGLLVVLMRGLQNFSDRFTQTGGPIRRFQTDLGRSGDGWLLVGGGVMMILGLQALLTG